MVTIGIRGLTEEEKVVFDAITEQSLKYPDRPFAYNVAEGQLFINRSGHRIDRERHLEIIQTLDKDGVIEADWLLPPEDEQLPLIFHNFANGRDWATKVLMDLEAVLALAARRCKYDDYYFINLHPKHAEDIDKASEFAGVANININKDDQRYIDVVFKDAKNNKERTMMVCTFRSEEDNVFYAVRYALRVTFATKQMLKTKAENNAGELVLEDLVNVPKMFDGNNIINGVLLPFFNISSKGLGINRDVRLSRYELELIEKAAVASR